ncbi:hypothetical protein CQA88_31515 [Klebsiella pneumoniae]|nr:hypothetical protein CQA88_31515 [Klebsiella pneumoniae]
MPAALPGVVVGVGLILLWNQPFWPRSPYNTLWHQPVAGPGFGANRRRAGPAGRLVGDGAED